MGLEGWAGGLGGGGEAELPRLRQSYLTLQCQHQLTVCIKMGSDESHFPVPAANTFLYMNSHQHRADNYTFGRGGGCCCFIVVSFFNFLILFFISPSYNSTG